MAIQSRLEQCKLTLNEQKTKMVYCKDSNRKADHAVIQFDFLGYTFRPRCVKSREGKFFTGFNPAISQAARKRLGNVMRQWKPKCWIHLGLEEIAGRINPVVQGWINYYGKFYASELRALLVGVNIHLAHWVRRKFKRLRYRKAKSFYWLGNIAQKNPALFAHWQWGVQPTAEQ